MSAGAQGTQCSTHTTYQQIKSEAENFKKSWDPLPRYTAMRGGASCERASLQRCDMKSAVHSVGKNKCAKITRCARSIQLPPRLCSSHSTCILRKQPNLISAYATQTCPRAGSPQSRLLLTPMRCSSATLVKMSSKEAVCNLVMPPHRRQLLRTVFFSIYMDARQQESVQRQL